MDMKRGRRHAKTTGTAAAVLAILLVLSGCGSNHSGSSTQTPGSSLQGVEDNAQAAVSSLQNTEDSSQVTESALQNAEDSSQVTESALQNAENSSSVQGSSAQDTDHSGEEPGENMDASAESVSAAETPIPAEEVLPVSPPWTISWNPEWEFADLSEIHEGTVKRYFAEQPRKEKVVAVNAGHGTKGGESVKTPCHPDGSAKVTGGSTGKGSTKAAAVTGGTSFLSGGSEAEANLQLALLLKEELLKNGYDVLMIREEEDVQLDNIARTVFANNMADCHIALHYDSTDSDKGFYYISVPDVSSYRSMEPVKSHWEEHHALGEALLEGARELDLKIYNKGSLPIDLTQTSYSTVPSVDVEVGDRASDHSEETQRKIAQGIAAGIDRYDWQNS